MPIDTSSYYPEVKGPEDDPDEMSLNERHTSLFGPEKKLDPDNEEPENKESLDKDPGKKLPEKRRKISYDTVPEKIFAGFSHFLSWILVPMLMPVYGILLIFGLSVLDVVSPGMRTAFTLIVAGINFVIPVLLILLLKFLGVVDDVGLNNRSERPIPYIIAALCLGGTAWFMATRGAPLWVCMFFTGGAVAALINFAVNFKWKISAHAAGMAGLIALLIRLEKDVAVEPRLFLWLLIVVGATGLLGSARIYLGRHTVWQVLAGYLVGFCSVFFLMMV